MKTLPTQETPVWPDTTPQVKQAEVTGRGGDSRNDWALKWPWQSAQDVYSAKSMYIYARFVKWGDIRFHRRRTASATDPTIVDCDAAQQASSQRLVFLGTALFFGVAAAVAALIDTDLFGGRNLVRTWLNSFSAPVYFTIMTLLVVVFIFFLYASRHLPLIFHVGALLLQASLLGVLLASVDIYVDGTYPGLYTALLVTGAYVVVLTRSPFDDEYLLKGPYMIALTALAVVGIASGVVYSVYPDFASAQETAIAFAVAAVLILISVGFDALLLFDLITPNEVVFAVTYILVDTTVIIVSITAGLVVAAVIIIGLSGMGSGCATPTACGCTCGCGRCCCGCECCEGDVNHDDECSHSPCCSLAVARNVRCGLGAYLCCLLPRSILATVEYFFTSVYCIFCCCLYEGLTFNPPRVRPSPPQAQANTSHSGAASTASPIDNQVMQR